MFQFSRLAAQTYVLGLRLFGNLRIKACLTAPRSFSQFSAPFKAFRRQDVPHALFLRLIAPIHHSLRNNRIGLFSVSPLITKDEIPKNVTFFEYSCYRSIKLLNSMNSTKL